MNLEEPHQAELPHNEQLCFTQLPAATRIKDMRARHCAAWVLPMIVFASFGGLATAQQRHSDVTPESQVLARWVGSWDTEIAIPSNPAAPDGAKARGTAVYDWIRKGSVLRSTWSVESNEGERLFNGTTEITYEPKTRSYRAVATWSIGIKTESVGSWDDKSSTMSWTTRDPLTKRVTIAKSNMAGNGIEKWTMMVADPKTGPVFECSGVNTRRSK